MSLLVRFIAFFAVLAVILVSFAEWSGGGEEVAGWTMFTDTLGSGPGSWYLPAPVAPIDTPSPEEATYETEPLDYWTVLYPHNQTWECEAVFTSSTLNAHHPLENESQSLRPFTAYPPQSVARWSTFIRTNTTKVIVDEGTWKLTTYMRIWSHYDHIYEEYPSGLDVTLRVIIWPFVFYNGPPTCNSDSLPEVMEYGVHITSYSAALTKRTWEVKVPSQTFNSYLVVQARVEFLNATWHGMSWPANMNLNAEIELQTGPGHEAKLNMPSLRGRQEPGSSSPQDCDFFCAIASFFTGFIQAFVKFLQWVFFVAYSIVWINWVIFATIAWFILVTALFFGGLFDLSITGTFGPFGAIVTIVTTVFIAYVVLTIVYLVRGTSGSVGV